MQAALATVCTSALLVVTFFPRSCGACYFNARTVEVEGQCGITSPHAPPRPAPHTARECKFHGVVKSPYAVRPALLARRTQHHNRQTRIRNDFSCFFCSLYNIPVFEEVVTEVVTSARASAIEERGASAVLTHTACVGISVKGYTFGTTVDLSAAGKNTSKRKSLK